jgi:uncharacterized protein YbjQ (UPF0145 family)
MSFFGLFGNGPYMAWAKRIPLSRDAMRPFRNATYQVVASPHGLPMMQLDLDFQRLDRQGRPVTPLKQMFSSLNPTYNDWASATANPDMSVALLMDRSGSMAGSFRDGHVYNICVNILYYLQSAGVGYDLYFYDDRVSHYGHVSSPEELQRAISTNGPRGGTRVTQCLRQAINASRNTRGIYVVVVTDGEFQDKIDVQNYVVRELCPTVTPENPYALRLHFVGAGEGVDHEFLERLDQSAAGQGVQLVTAHHHAHLSHAHDSILDELDRSFIGAGHGLSVEEICGDEGMVTRIGEVTGRKWMDGSSAKFDFFPRHALVGLEFKQDHAPSLSVNVGVPLLHPLDAFSQTFSVPMPKSTIAGAGGGTSKSWKDLFLWTGRTPEEQAAREALKQRAAEVHEDEMRRQTADLIELAKGGIPTEAKVRLQELGKSADGEGFTFTSNLAPGEIALLRRNGVKVRGLVTGSSMYHVGVSHASSTNDCEVRELGQAYDRATELALSRMEQELIYLGAHGAVGVRLQLVRHEWSDKTIEVQAIGTAVERPGPAPARPWLCDLSGQEWYALHRAGYEPVALVYGHCSWFILTMYGDELMKTSWQNAEFGHWSDALRQARNIAMDKVRRLTKAAGGTGVTGVHVQRRLDEMRLYGPGTDPAYEREHHNLVISVIGTAVRERAFAEKQVRATQYVLSLRDGRLKPLVMRQDADLTIV